MVIKNRGDRVTQVRQTARHVRAHPPDSDKSYVHGLFIVRSLAASSAGRNF